MTQPAKPRVHAKHVPTTILLNRWRGVGVLCCTIFLACTAKFGLSSPPVSTGICPPGTHDYGDGMVASWLSGDVEGALEKAHTLASDSAGQYRSSYLIDQPWRPHVSIIYGVTADKALPAYHALEEFLKNSNNVRACFGGLQYWDDAVGDKTTVVVDVLEPASYFSALHDVLAQAAQITSRYAYHPHVTLIYLKAHARLSTESEAIVLAPLRGLCWPAEAFYLTDSCGQQLYRSYVAAHASLPNLN